MRKVSAWLFMSLDGVVEAPNEWQFDVMDDEMLGDIISQSDAEDAIVMGRVTYQDFAPSGPLLRTIPSQAISTMHPSTWSQRPWIRSSGGIGINQH